MRRQDFGAAVRQLRERVDPAAAGLPVTGRRVSGLRREELGELAGMSADYVRRLEQGRSHPSAGVVNALARALGAGRADYERLCALAGYAAADGRVPRDLGAGATRLLESFPGTPMIITDASTGVVATNGAFLALEHWDLTGERWEWNLAWRQFCRPFDGFRQAEADSTDHEGVLVAQLQEARLRYPADAPLADLVDEVRTRSRRFDALWRAPRPVTAYESSATFTQSDGGSVTLVGNLVAVPGDGLSAVVLTAAKGSRDASRLAEVVGSSAGPDVVRVGLPGPG